MGRLHLLPGSTFSNPQDRGDSKSEEAAAVTMSELILWTVYEINGRYHNEPHSSLKLPDGTERAPLQA